MKFLMILIVVTFINACGGAKKSVTNTVKEEVSINKDVENIQNDMVIEYKENSRGYHKLIKITSETVYGKFKHDGEFETKPCDKALWANLMKEIEAINLNEIPELEAPSKTHTYDAKPMARLKITKQDKTYSTVTFDAGNPHIKLASIIDHILTAITKKN